MQRIALVACVMLAMTAIAGLIDLLVVEPYRGGAERIAALQLDLDAVTIRTEEARRRLAVMNSTAPIDTSGLTMPGGDSATALAALQDRVRRAVSSHGGQAQSTVGSVAEASDGFSRLVVGLTVRFEEASLFAFLRDLEGGTPPLVVEGLAVRPLPVPRGLPLDVNVTLVSFGVRPNAP